MPSSLTNMIYHIVFSTKNRQNYISPLFRDDLYHYIGGIIRSEKGILLEIGGISDHIHILAKFHPAISVSDMLKQIKGSSSRWLNKTKQLQPLFSWQRGYGAFSVSESACDRVRHYIRKQEEHHRKMAFTEEFVLMLEKHHIDYDERYLWD